MLFSQPFTCHSHPVRRIDPISPAQPFRRSAMSTAVSTKPAAEPLLLTQKRIWIIFSALIAGHAALQPGPDHRLHRHAHHRRQARRRGAPGLDHHRLPARHHHRDAHLRQVRRRPGPPEPVPRRHRAVHARLGRLRLRHRLLGLRDLPRHPGPRRRRPDDPVAGHHRRHRPGQGARQVHGPAGRHLRPLRRRRPAAGRLLRGPPDLGMGLLHQHPRSASPRSPSPGSP